MTLSIKGAENYMYQTISKYTYDLPPVAVLKLIKLLFSPSKVSKLSPVDTPTTVILYCVPGIKPCSSRVVECISEVKLTSLGSGGETII